MKTIIILLITLFSQISFSQDLITFKDGSVKSVNIKEISETEVKYHKPENLSVIYSVLKTSLFSVQFKNGEKEVFNQPVAIITPQVIIPTKVVTIVEQPKAEKPKPTVKASILSVTPEVQKPIPKPATITFKNGTVKSVNVTEITDTEVKYTKSDNSSIIYTVLKTDLNSILYKNEEKEVWNGTVIAPKIETFTVVEEHKSLDFYTPNNKSINYKGYIEVSYATSPFEKNYGVNNTKIKAADVLMASTSHGILLNDLFFVGLGGQYLKTLSSGATNGFIGHGDIRYSILNSTKFRLNIGSKIGYLQYKLIENVYQSSSQIGVLTTTGGLMINPFLSGEIAVSTSNNLIISGGYLSQKYIIIYDKNGSGRSTLFNDDFEYFNFTVGLSF